MGGTDVYVAREHWSRRGTWNRDRVIAALQDWTTLVGSPPRAYEWAPASAAGRGLASGRGRLWAQQYPRWPSTSTVTTYFDRWSLALEAAGLSVNRRVAGGEGREERIAAAQRMARAQIPNRAIADTLGIAPRTVRDYLRAGRCADCDTFVVTAARCPRCAARRTNRPWADREEVLEAIREWAERTGAPPRVEDWTPTSDPRRRWAREYPRWPSFMTVRTHFGSWPAALAAAGSVPNRVRWSPEAIVAAFRAFAEESGRSPAQSDLRWPRLPSPGAVRRHFGSHHRALAAAGLSPRHRRWEREDILDAIARFERRYGRPPAAREWSTSTDEHPHASTVRRQFGSWAAANIRVSGRRYLREKRAAAAARADFPDSRSFA
jgi:hypothetical protein